MTALKAMNSKLQLVFLRIMRVFVLERIIPPLVITFELAYKQSCDCHDICKQSVGHVSTTKYVDSFLSNLIFALFLFLFISHYLQSVHGHSPKPFYNEKSVHGPRAIACCCFLILFLHYFCFWSFLIISKKESMNPAMTGGAWTASMKLVYGPGPKWGSTDPWSIYNRLKFDSRIFHSLVQ